MSSNITDQSAAAQDNEIIDKGKGKAIQQPEETEAETSEDEEMDEDAEEDELAEIDSSNIIQNGRRTRGKQIDFVAAAAKEQPAGDDDEEDDEDFVAPEEADDKDIEMH